MTRLLFAGNMFFGLFALAVCVFWCTDPVYQTACAFFGGANLAFCFTDLFERRRAEGTP